MGPQLEFRDDSDRLSVEGLFVHLNVGLTLAAIAVDRYDPDAKARTVRIARTAYEDVSRRRLNVQMDGSEASRMETKLLLLKNRLLTLGEIFD